MEQRFGRVMDSLAIVKKMADYEQLLRMVFSFFNGHFFFLFFSF